MFPELLGEPPQGCEIIEGILPAQAAGLNDAHEEVADFRAIHRFIDQGVIAVSDRGFQDSLTDIVVEWGSRLVQEQCQLIPPLQDVMEG